MCGMSDRGKGASLRRLSARGRDVDVVQNNGAMLRRRDEGEEEGMGRAKEEEEEK